MSAILESVKNPYKKILLIIILLLICCFVVSLVTKPLRIKWSKNYVVSGDSYLAQKKYLHAEVEYKKSLFLYWKNDTANQKLALAQNAETNVLLLKDFYQTTNKSEFDLLNNTIKLPDTSVTAVKNCKDLIGKNEYQLAIIAAQNAVEMDKNYRDAWVYLGIANLETAEFTELTTKNQEKYLADAKSAMEKASTLDPEYQTTKDYLAQIIELLKK